MAGAMESARQERARPAAAAPTTVSAAQPPLPDLLYEKASLRIDAGSLRDNLPFAFVSGDASGSIEEALAGMQVEESGWKPSAFADELFLDDLIAMCMRAHFDGFQAPLNRTYLKRVISSPPRCRADVDFRRAALVELWDNELLRAHVNLAYRRLCHVMVLFDSQGYTSRYDDLERRLEIVGVMRAVVKQMAAAPEARSPGIERMREFARAVTHTDAFRQLDEFLDYKERLAAVEIKLAVQIDGKIGAFEVRRVEENTDNRFHHSPWRRLLSKVFLFLRGYRFTESEVIERWIDKVFTATLDFLPLLFQLKGDLEFYLAAMAFREFCEERGLFVCLPTFATSDATPVTITQLFNPLLFSQEIIPVCCDLRTGGGESMTVVTGPNSGGKTRLLQAIAIHQLLAQAGMYAPAETAEVRWSTGMFVSLVEGARLDQEEGRLGSEMLRIRRVFEQSGDVSLVIIDELCSGTNPSEGEEIFLLVMSLLRELQPLVFVTTHFLQFAKRLEADNHLNLEFLQVELDDDKQPTFGFVAGVAASSLARETAARLGVTQEELRRLIACRRTDDVS
jgi:DNA mismatch repair protein MutS2